MIFLSRVFVGMLVLGVAACDQPPAIDIDLEKDRLIATDRSWSGMDVEKQIEFLADDAVYMVEGMPLILGKAAIAEIWREEEEIPGFTLTWEPDHVVVSESGELGYTFGSNVVSVDDATGARTTTKGKYVTIWRKQPDGSWKVVLDIVNSDGPPVAGLPPN